MEELKGKILIADDEQGMCDSLAILLRRLGYEVSTIDCVQTALALLGMEFFDVVVTDIVFPDGKGFEIMEFCRKYCPKTKVIAMTGQASMDSAIQALRSGAHDYVIKPFDFDLLHHAIQKAFEQQQMEESIDFAEDRYRALVEDLDDGYVVLEGDTIVYANRTMCRFLECDFSRLVGRNFYDFVDPVSQKKLREHVQFIRKGKRFQVSDEIMLKAAGGRSLTAEVKLSNTASGKGGAATVVMCRDVSDRKSLWDKLVKAEKLALMGEMVAGIAHELNNKLTPILAYTELMGQKELSEDIKKHVESVYASAIGAKNIVDSLLLFSRQEKPEKVLCDVNEMVRISADLVSSSFGGSSIKLKLKLADDLPYVIADRYQIEQVLVNIIKNAYEVVEEDGEIVIETARDNGEVAISITDDGPGIPPHIEKRIFDPFFTTKEEGKGTGLGLSICLGILREHDGEISVCTGDWGTTFRISLPANNAKPRVDKPKKAEVNVQISGKPSILIVEDEHKIAELLKEILVPHFEVTITSNGKEALEHVSKREFDLIISDIRMPVMDGIELYHRLKERHPEYCDRKKIIYTTGVTFDQETQIFLNDTKVTCLRKPFKVKEILSVISRMSCKERALQ